jgi:hypothetical protein
MRQLMDNLNGVYMNVKLYIFQIYMDTLISSIKDFFKVSQVNYLRVGPN